MIKLIKKVVTYTDKTTGEEKTFTKVSVRIYDEDSAPVDIDIRATGKDDAQANANTRVLKMFAEKVED